MMEFENIDTVFASSVLRQSNYDENCFIALCYLFASSRQGHHCVSIIENNLKPLPERVLENLLSSSEFNSRVILGFAKLPKEVFQEAADKLTLKPIVKERHHYYLQKYFFLEMQIAECIERLSGAPLKLVFSKEEIEEELCIYKDVLNKEQQEAILDSLCCPVHLLTGGPGTGKTYTIHYLLQVYKALCKKHLHTPKILLAAPTGKATSHLKSKFSDAQIEVGTLHSALKIKKKEDLYTKHYLFKDLIIVDECSMIDLHLWRALLSSVQEGSRVIFMGDHEQLPPVETGMVFEEFIKVLPCSYLKKCMRTERQGLLSFASSIKENKEDILEEFLSKASAEVRYVEYENEIDIFSLEGEILENTLTADSKVILSPVLQGPWGVETINEKLYGFFLQKAHHKGVLEIPIMITKTNYTQELFNGDRGVLFKYVGYPAKDYALFESKTEEIPGALLPPYQYAYALSVHKSQGSEYDEVLLLLPEGSQHFGKEVIYTGVTRAKKKITIIAKKGILKKCLEGEAKKNSALSEKIFLNVFKKNNRF